MTNPNWPAYPVVGETTVDGCGLTKLELFAAMAMQGLAANPHAWEEQTIPEQVDTAILYAKALIAALEKEQVRT